MTSSHNVQTAAQHHAGPPPGIVALTYALLFVAGLYPVTAFGGRPTFPQPGQSLNSIVAFFQLRPSAVLFWTGIYKTLCGLTNLYRASLAPVMRSAWNE
ncbi:MAG TPA: hypothetical protein VGM27_27855 [Acidobacteriaceae bacterium]